MTKLVDFIRYLKTHGIQSKDPGKEALTRAHYIAHLNEAITEASKIITESREPWMLTSWTFDVVALQKDYLLSSIAPGGNLGVLDNFYRPHSLHLMDASGSEWAPWALLDLYTAMEVAAPKNTLPRPVAFFELVPGAGTVEGAFRIRFENPPNFSIADGGRFAFYYLPAMIPDGAVDTYEPAIPRFADRFIKVFAMRNLMLSQGHVLGWKVLGDEQDKAELSLRGSVSGGISDLPQYVTDVGAAEDGRYTGGY